ncbi:MAG: hypothetical protein FWG45_02275 [Oscillospiraceae bacterium]|nr:hypothetical protein [Oscillospiraceae bacterium]
MTDVGFIEELMNGNSEPLTVDSTVNHYSLGVGDVVVDVDKDSRSYVEETDVYEQTSFLNESAAVSNESVFEESSVVNHASFVESKSDIVNEIVEVHEIVNESHEANEVFESGGVVNEYNDVIEQVQNVSYHDSVVNDVREVNEGGVVNEVSEVCEGDSFASHIVHHHSSPVTVNFTANNEVRMSEGGSGADVESVLSAFGERLAEAVALAAEGVHL